MGTEKKEGRGGDRMGVAGAGSCLPALCGL